MIFNEFWVHKISLSIPKSGTVYPLGFKGFSFWPKSACNFFPRAASEFDRDDSDLRMSWSTPKSGTAYPTGKVGFRLDGSVIGFYHGTVPAGGLKEIAEALAIRQTKLNFILFYYNL